LLKVQNYEDMENVGEKRREKKTVGDVLGLMAGVG